MVFYLLSDMYQTGVDIVALLTANQPSCKVCKLLISYCPWISLVATSTIPL